MPQINAVAGRGACESKCQGSKTDCQFHESHLEKFTPVNLFMNGDYEGMPTAVSADRIIARDFVSLTSLMPARKLLVCRNATHIIGRSAGGQFFQLRAP
jgi:hypothetical protein